LLAAIKTSAGKQAGRQGREGRPGDRRQRVRTHGEQSFSLNFGIFMAKNSVTHAANYVRPHSHSHLHLSLPVPLQLQLRWRHG